MAKKKGKKKSRKSWSQRKFTFRIFLRDYNLILSTVLVTLCIVMIVFGGIALFMYDSNPSAIPQPFRDWVAFLHGAQKSGDPQYDLCMFPVGLLVVLIAGWYMADGIAKRREFEKLMDTDSKSEFIENLDDLEELAWKLGTKYEYIVADRKEELGIRKRKR